MDLWISLLEKGEKKISEFNHLKQLDESQVRCTNWLILSLPILCSWVLPFQYCRSSKFPSRISKNRDVPWLNQLSFAILVMILTAETLEMKVASPDANPYKSIKAPVSRKNAGKMINPEPGTQNKYWYMMKTPWLSPAKLLREIIVCCSNITWIESINPKPVYEKEMRVSCPSIPNLQHQWRKWEPT